MNPVKQSRQNNNYPAQTHSFFFLYIYFILIIPQLYINHFESAKVILHRVLNTLLWPGYINIKLAGQGHVHRVQPFSSPSQ